MADLNLGASPTARRPRGAVKLNGSILAGWFDFEVDNNAFRSADTFTVRFAAAALPQAYDAAWFGTQTSIIVELFATADCPDGPYTPALADRLIYGQTDDIHFDPVQGVIELTGRDLTARFIDTKTSENHQNATSSQVATLLAQREGLKPVVTATTTRIGQFYAIDHTDINQQQSEWDLLTRLADFEDFDVFVTGDELHFQPKPADGGDRYALTWAPPNDETAHPNANMVTLGLSRSLTIAKGVSVEVRSWNAKQKKAFTSTWPKAVKSTKPGKAQSSDPNGTLVYHFHVPGLTQDQAVAHAKALYEKIVAHMVKLEADLPGDGILDCTKMIALRGTGTVWDQTYYPDSVKRSMSMDEGYRMTVSAKNISQEFDTAAG